MLLLSAVCIVCLASHLAVDAQSLVEASPSSVPVVVKATTSAAITTSELVLQPSPVPPTNIFGSGSAVGPVIEPPPVTYGNLTCEPYYAGGECQPILEVYPKVVTNVSRSDQVTARYYNDLIFMTLIDFDSSEMCLSVVLPIFCRYTFPTCDPAFSYNVPVYQPICRRDCEVIRDFYCPEPWAQLQALINVADFGVIDDPDCEPLEYADAGTAPMCISILYEGEIPLPLRTGETCYSGRGRGYNGTISVTETGEECQVWTSDTLHQHLLARDDYPEIKGDHNYCRNPGDRGERPWCFTTNRHIRWEYCDVPQCDPGPTCELYTGGTCRTMGSIGMDQIYFNTTIGDQSDYETAMDKLLPTILDYPEECIDVLLPFICVSNFPSCDLSSTSPRPHQVCKEYCEMVYSVCEEELDGLKSFSHVINHDPVVIPECSELPEASNLDPPECWQPVVIPNFAELGTSECYSTEDNGETYNGMVSVTENGRKCMAWDSQSPHIHPITSLFRRYLESHNYCRNPEGRGDRPWCYTTDPAVRWENCSVPVCTTESTSEEDDIVLIVTIAIPVIAGILVICAVLILLCVCCHSIKSSQKARQFQGMDNERYSHGPELVKMVDMKTTQNMSGANPLYAINSFPSPEPFGYDSINLPQYPRENIVYIRDLGQGHFGVVVQAEAKDVIPGGGHSVVAIKVLREGATDQIKKEFFREANLMHAFDHPNIVKLLGVCIEQEPLCMLFEYMELGDLNNFLRQNAPAKWGSTPSLNRSVRPGLPGLNTQQLVHIVIDIATGLEYLALNHYVHRDLATRNCLVDSNFRVKISDFGLSQDIYSTDYFRLGDSELLPIRWMPPEAILFAKFTTQSDIWSFGVVLWETFSFGMQPYCALSNEEVVKYVRDGHVMSCPEGCPSEIYDLMLDCWAMESNDRPTAAEIHMGLRRWNPEMSANLQTFQQQPKKSDYQNMATIREYAMQPSTTSDGELFVPDLNVNDPSSPPSYKAAYRSDTSPDPESETSEAPLVVHALPNFNERQKYGSPPREIVPTVYEHTV